ncbi:MAG: hypothetical protein HOM58_00270 [Rhodospirillaceae bacterium]|nr:hypothetical protein [Rhodospirillaceae bacterium]MBT5457814.1 hypothetical protein [Rhodospirillaceae bacterium]
MIIRFSALVAFLLVFAGPLGAGAQGAETQSHMVIADPAALSGTRAESVYQSIRWTMRGHYLDSGDPVTGAYQTWPRYNKVPYRSSLHGEIFVNNYANPLARHYGKFEKLGRLPEGAIVIKDSFTVTERGEVMTGPLFLMEKKEPGFNVTSNDWLFMTIAADGTVEGMTKGKGAKKVQFCATCHNKAPGGHDNLYFLPEEIRQRN